MSETTRKQVYNLEVGVLLTKDDPEFEAYMINQFYELEKFSFYDENRIAGFDKDKLIKEGLDYIKEGVNGTYAIVYNLGLHKLTKSDIREIETTGYLEDYCSDNPTLEDTYYFAYKNQNGEIIVEINKVEKVVCVRRK